MSKTTNTYLLPLPEETEIKRIVHNNEAHLGPFVGAVDLVVESGTDVLAPREGRVMRVIDSYDKYGEIKDFEKFTNLVDIEHENGEYSQLCHLAKDSAVVKVGDEVKKGQKLAMTGLSGWMTEPHLHWIVYKKVSEHPGFKGLEIRLERSLEDLTKSS